MKYFSAIKKQNPVIVIEVEIIMISKIKLDTDEQ